MALHRKRAVLPVGTVELSRVRNLLKSIRILFERWDVRVGGMIHPDAASDPFLAPLHRSFLISSFASGAAALIVLPLHLALAGPPHAAVLLVLSWMLSQWPLALFLSRTGALNKAIGLSSGLFAVLIAAVCLLTGGAGSFALVWLLVPLMEAAFATDRKTPFAITLLCGGLLAGVALLPMPHFQIAAPVAGAAFYTTLAALVYTGVLAFRLSIDRMLARQAVHRASADRQLIAQGTADVVCEVSSEGAIRLLGGPISELVGQLPLADGEDWLFPRLHVADRPLYLTHLSEARQSGGTQRFNVRFRVGASSPGEAGLADYRCLSLTLQPPGPAALPGNAAAQTLVLTLADGDLALRPEAKPPGDVTGERDLARFDTSIQEGRSLAGIARLEVSPRLTCNEATDHPEPGQGQQSVSAMALPSVLAACDLAVSLEQCRDLLTPVAARRGIHLDLEAQNGLPKVVVDAKGLKQALNCLLADMIESCGEGAVLLVSAHVSDALVTCKVAISGRPSAQRWRADDAGSVIDKAAALLGTAGAELCVESGGGRADQLSVLLPVRNAGNAAALAKTA